MTSEIQNSHNQPNLTLEEANAEQTPSNPVAKYLVKGDIPGIQGFIFKIHLLLMLNALVITPRIFVWQVHPIHP